MEHPEIGWMERTGYPSWLREDRQQAVEQITVSLLRKLQKAVEELDMEVVAVNEKTKTEKGERVEKFLEAKSGGLVDRSGLRQITGALKDLSELDNVTMDLREQEARIAKLRREAGFEQTGQTGVVLLPRTQGEAEEARSAKCEVLSAKC